MRETSYTSKNGICICHQFSHMVKCVHLSTKSQRWIGNVIFATINLILERAAHTFLLKVPQWHEADKEPFCHFPSKTKLHRTLFLFSSSSNLSPSIQIIKENRNVPFKCIWNGSGSGYGVKLTVMREFTDFLHFYWSYQIYLLSPYESIEKITIEKYGLSFISLL